MPGKCNEIDFETDFENFAFDDVDANDDDDDDGNNMHCYDDVWKNSTSLNLVFV